MEMQFHRSLETTDDQYNCHCWKSRNLYGIQLGTEWQWTGGLKQKLKVVLVFPAAIAYGMYNKQNMANKQKNGYNLI